MTKITTILHRFIGTTMEELALKAIDYFTVFHIIFGCISYLVSLGILGILGFDYASVLYAIIVTLYIAIIWEIIENNIITRTKFKTKKDSLNNSLFDVIFTHLGSLLGFLLMGDLIILILVLFLLFIIGDQLRHATRK